MKMPQSLFGRIEYALIQMAVAKREVQPSLVMLILKGSEDIEKLIDDFQEYHLDND